MIYLDTSALAKLVRVEAESEALEQWLEGQQRTPRISSSLARVELVRAVRDLGAGAIRQARAILDRFDRIPLSEKLLDEAAEVDGPLRSLDAIHLASALRLGKDLTALVAYDRRLLLAASDLGLPVASPGAA